MLSSTIGGRIRNRREQLKLSQEELAKRLGFKSRSSINKIELNQRNLTQSKIKAIADALETTPCYIMGWEAQDNPPTPSVDDQGILLREIVGIARELNEQGQELLLCNAKWLKDQGYIKNRPNGLVKSAAAE